MSDEYQFNRKIFQLLDSGNQSMDRRITSRLHAARQTALARHQQVSVSGLQLAGVGFGALGGGGYRRTLLAAIALVVGVFVAYATTSYLQQLEHATETAAIDTALLADEIPFNAYLDQDFLEWLDHLAQYESSQG